MFSTDRDARSTPSSSSSSASAKPCEQKSRRHLTLNIPSAENYPQSAAERYILSRAQALNAQTGFSDMTPDTPSSVVSTHSSTASSPMSHIERMENWHAEQRTLIQKKQKHRYVYGPPPTTSPMRVSLPTPPASSSSSSASPSPTSNNSPFHSAASHGHPVERPKSFFRKFL